ncbi:MAG: site-specific DNA-methyltransferase, partial [Chloroflexota bacterium]
MIAATAADTGAGAPLVFGNEAVQLYCADCFDWLRLRAPNSVHAVVTDPPYGFIEYQEAHLEKMKNGAGGVW